MIRTVQQIDQLPEQGEDAGRRDELPELVLQRIAINSDRAASVKRHYSRRHEIAAER